MITRTSFLKRWMPLNNFLQTWATSQFQSSLKSSQKPSSLWALRDFASQGHEDDLCLCIIQLELMNLKPASSSIFSAFTPLFMSLVSSAKISILSSKKWSLICRIKSRGTRTLPWGTPHVSQAYNKRQLKWDFLLSVY